MISAVILTKNEEKNIERAIKSVSFCDEVIVVDDSSTDKTAEIAKRLGAHVFKRALNGDFAGQRNFGIERANPAFAKASAGEEWILHIDADEEVTPELKKEVEQETRNKRQETNDAYYIKRRDFWRGREMKFGETMKARNQGLLRLVRKNAGKWVGLVHESFQTSKPTGRLQNFINHYPHQTVAEFLKHINFYSTARASELKDKNISTNIFQIVTYPLFKFIYTYFILFGFLDGVPGFIYSFMMSFHSFLVRSKLYMMDNKHLTIDM